MVHVCCRTPLKAPPPDTAFGTVGPRFSNYSHAPLLLPGLWGPGFPFPLRGRKRARGSSSSSSSGDGKPKPALANQESPADAASTPARPSRINR